MRSFISWVLVPLVAMVAALAGCPEPPRPPRVESAARPPHAPTEPAPGMDLASATARLTSAGFVIVEQRVDVHLALSAWIRLRRGAGNVHLTLQFLGETSPGQDPPEDPPYLLIGNGALLRLVWTPAVGSTIHRDLAADARAILAIAPIERLPSELGEGPAYAALLASWSLRDLGIPAGGQDVAWSATSRYFHGTAGSFTLQAFDYAAGDDNGRGRLIGTTLATVGADDDITLATAALAALAQ